MQDAIAVARKQNARAFLLRATSDLCQLLMARGDHDRARRFLEAQLHGLEEGLETADRAEAEKLLRSAAPAERQALRSTPA